MLDLDYTSITIAKRLKALREREHLSHTALSQALLKQYGIRISKESLLNYEVDVLNNHSKAKKNMGMRIEYLLCLSDFYQVSSDYLLGISETPSKEKDIQAICNAGLSSDAVTSIQKLSKTTISMSVLNLILSHPDFKSYLDTLFMCAIQTAAYRYLQSQVDFTSPITSIEEHALKTGLSDNLDMTEVHKNRACESFENYVLRVLMDENMVQRQNNFPESIPKLQSIVKENAIVEAERAVQKLRKRFSISEEE